MAVIHVGHANSVVKEHIMGVEDPSLLLCLLGDSLPISQTNEVTTLDMVFSVSNSNCLAQCQL